MIKTLEAEGFKAREGVADLPHALPLKLTVSKMFDYRVPLKRFFMKYKDADFTNGGASFRGWAGHRVVDDVCRSRW